MASIYIIGAGLAGRMLAKEIQQKQTLGVVRAFLDDDPQKRGSTIDGIPVIGPIDGTAHLIRITPSDEALIAIPSIHSDRLREIYTILKKAGFSTIKLLPALSQIINGDAHLIQTREIDPQDLLTRTPIKINLKQSLGYLRGKRVLITGAGGSIGSELARQLLLGGAQRLYLFGHGENSIYQIDRELRGLQESGIGSDAIIVPIIGELKDAHYMHTIMQRLKCDVVFHTAAYKHVPMMEKNPVAVIENNVFGTHNLLEACLATGVKRFVLISTDKAVEPVSVYGISKFLNEKNVIEAAQKITDPNSAYLFVRFGNVLGSRGSIFPLFVEQIKKGGPVTVTHPQMIRYFMTIPEACSLVLQAGGVGKNAASYLLDMGEPVNILETAHQIIRYLGHEPERDIPIEIIGLRDGERLSEPLISSTETVEKTEYPKILSLHEQCPYDLAKLKTLRERLYPCCFFTGDTDAYRNASLLLDILCEAFESIRSIYDT